MNRLLDLKGTSARERLNALRPRRWAIADLREALDLHAPGYVDAWIDAAKRRAGHPMLRHHGPYLRYEPHRLLPVYGARPVADGIELHNRGYQPLFVVIAHDPETSARFDRLFHCLRAPQVRQDWQLTFDATPFHQRIAISIALCEQLLEDGFETRSIWRNEDLGMES